MNDSDSERNLNELTKKRKVTVFTIVAISLLMVTIDSTIVATALHTLQTELNTTVNWAGWTLTAYALGLVLMLPLSADLSIRYGHRRVFTASIAVFTLASLLCGLVNSIYPLIVLRFIQALGGAGITPSVTGIIVNHFGDDRDRAVSLFGSIFPIGGMIGPIFGGLFITYLDWRWIFFVNIPFGIIVILMSMKYIPADIIKKSLSDKKFDVLGIVLMCIGILAGMFAASYLSEKGSSPFSAVFIGLIAVLTVSFIFFFRHINKVQSPFILPKFIYGTNFGAVNLINVIYSGAAMGLISLVPLFAANHFGIDALKSGTLLTAQGVAAIIMSLIMTALLRKTGYRMPLYAGCTSIILGAVLLALPPQFGISPYWWLALSCFLIGAGVGTNSPPSRNAGLQLAPDQSATLAAIRSLGIQIGSIVVISVSTAIISEAGDSGYAHAYIHLAMAFVFVLGLMIIPKIPEHKGAW